MRPTVVVGDTRAEVRTPMLPSSTDGAPQPEGTAAPLPEPLLIAPTGELDAANVGDFRVALSEAAGDAAHAVVVDLSDVDFIDSSALGALVELYQRLRRKERRLAVVAPRGTAAAVVLNLAGLQSRLPIHEARPAALEM